MNCLEHCLEQSIDSKLEIWYNSDHVIIIDVDMTDKGYLRIDEFGYDHLVKSFKLSSKYRRILKEYLK